MSIIFLSIDAEYRIQLWEHHVSLSVQVILHCLAPKLRKIGWIHFHDSYLLLRRFSRRFTWISRSRQIIVNGLSCHSFWWYIDCKLFNIACRTSDALSRKYSSTLFSSVSNDKMNEGWVSLESFPCKWLFPSLAEWSKFGSQFVKRISHLCRILLTRWWWFRRINEWIRWIRRKSSTHGSWTWNRYWTKQAIRHVSIKSNSFRCPR